ncbi:hypothetical protein [Sphingomicrobium astaxanthinifaciens]|uniref:hypothetical protein n=1 Tax=Sphingomicrobium astaxanthinifaciens TaxID=1227949 RepID=UPI001FCABDA1|nr:hypothetical protein [Sphingomicrobium astaxanthinifaciens]MCJ7421783.1 hypothetical protein [Sphingomicrobium astaxanthinifaciens]
MIALLATYCAAVALFAIAFTRLGIIATVPALMREMRTAFAVIGDKALDDEAKEAAVRQTSIALLGKALKLALGLAAVLAAAAIPALLAEAAGWSSMAAFIAFSLDPIVLLATIGVFVALGWLLKRRRASA